MKKITVVGVIKKRSKSCVKLRVGCGQGCVTKDLNWRDGAGSQIAYGGIDPPVQDNGRTHAVVLKIVCEMVTGVRVVGKPPRYRERTVITDR